LDSIQGVSWGQDDNRPPELQSISVDAPNAMAMQVVPRKDFETIWKIWIDYKSQKVKRYELGDMTRFSKYIISIFHWLEKSSG